MTKAYLGDGVYVALERGMIKLTTENGLEATNTIWLEAEVAEGLRAYIDRALRKEVSGT